MTTTLPYHRPRDALVLSLRFLNPSRGEAERVVSDLQAQTADDVRIETEIEEFTFDRTVYTVYAARSHPKQFPEHWDRDLPADTVILVDSVINTVRGVQEEWNDRGEPLNYYKEPKPRRIAEAFDRVEWRQDVCEVGGELMSSLILTHALPNANHRTAVAYLRTYLQSMTDDPAVDFSHAGNFDGDWYEWARTHIYESKRLLLLRRKSDLLRYAKKFGVETVRRKSGIEIDLTAHDFENDDIASLAEEGHRNRCIQFTVDLLQKSGQEDLIHRRDDGRRAFIDRLR